MLEDRAEVDFRGKQKPNPNQFSCVPDHSYISTRHLLTSAGIDTKLMEGATQTLQIFCQQKTYGPSLKVMQIEMGKQQSKKYQIDYLLHKIKNHLTFISKYQTDILNKPIIMLNIPLPTYQNDRCYISLTRQI